MISEFVNISLLEIGSIEFIYLVYYVVPDLKRNKMDLVVSHWNILIELTEFRLTIVSMASENNNIFHKSLLMVLF